MLCHPDAVEGSRGFEIGLNVIDELPKGLLRSLFGLVKLLL